jgi:hypothetical protein
MTPPCAWMTKHSRMRPATAWASERTLPSATPASCACAHAVEGDDMAHALGCNRLWSCASLHDESSLTTPRKCCNSSTAASPSPPAARGCGPGLLPATPTAPRPAATSIEICARAQVTHSATSPSSIPSPLPTVAPPFAPLAMLLLSGTLTSIRALMQTTHAQDTRSAPGLPHHQPSPGLLGLPMPHPAWARSRLRGCRFHPSSCSQLRATLRPPSR